MNNMEPAELPGNPHSTMASQEAFGSKLRLYVARSTPSSVRAEHNLVIALEQLPEGFTFTNVEIIDVFLQPKRAITDGVVVTPTLIGSTSHKRIVLIGDLSDQVQLKRILQNLVASPTAR
jgi:circadian clock protein KaiB